jgi:hypothetical protein
MAQKNSLRREGHVSVVGATLFLRCVREIFGDQLIQSGAAPDALMLRPSESDLSQQMPLIQTARLVLRRTSASHRAYQAEASPDVGVGSMADKPYVNAAHPLHRT